MNYKTLDKLSTLYLKLKDLDAEIVKLEKLALQMATRETIITFNLSIVDVAEKDKVEKALVMDGDGSIKKQATPQGMISFVSLWGGNTITEDHSEKYTTILNAPIPDLTAISMIGIMLGDMNKAREEIVCEIKKTSAGLK